MEQEKSLDDILNDEPSEAQAEPEQQEEQSEPEVQTEGQPRDETGKFAKKGDDGAPPAPDKNEYDGAATIAERRKRQEAEERLKALEQELQALRNPPAPLPSIFEDEQAVLSHLTEKFNAELYQRDLKLSERFARQTYGDAEVEAALEWGRARCASDPSFNQQVASSGDPVGFAVAQYKRDQIASTVTPEDFEQFQAWKNSLATGQAPQPQGIPPTLSNERNLGTRSGPQWTGPKPLGDLLA